MNALRIVRRLVLTVLATLVIVFAAATIWALKATPQLRDRVVNALNERFESQIALQSLDAAVFPQPRASGRGLEFRHKGRTDVPPLISIENFETTAAILGLVRSPVRLEKVSVERLFIRIPPGGLHSGNDDKKDAENAAPHVSHPEQPSPIEIERIQSRAARLEVASSRPGRLPRVWDIQNLDMRNFGALTGSKFEAALSNPVPRGTIDTTGVFGPWHADKPELTPVSGNYIFQNADLNVIKGLGGILSSNGSYRGVLERIEVEGTTETPDFSLDLAGQKVPLSTRFKAVVDGTNGDTILERVEALLNKSTILASGSVVRTEEVKGRRVDLDVRLTAARLEDVLQLAMKGPHPPLTGRVDLKTHMVLPAGPADVVDRLQLDGAFQLAQARFTNLNVQRRITTLSRRGRGEESDEGAENERVVSNLRGRFKLANAALTFSELTFAVPGSIVTLQGSYNLHSGAMDFTGDLLTDASLADMTSGVKSVLARLAQPFFRRKGGGSRLPIRISGTREKPQFGLDMRRVLRRG